MYLLNASIGIVREMQRNERLDDGVTDVFSCCWLAYMTRSLTPKTARLCHARRRKAARIAKDALCRFCLSEDHTHRRFRSEFWQGFERRCGPKFARPDMFSSGFAVVSSLDSKKVGLHFRQIASHWSSRRFEASGLSMLSWSLRIADPCRNSVRWRRSWLLYSERRMLKLRSVSPELRERCTGQDGSSFRNGGGSRSLRCLGEGGFRAHLAGSEVDISYLQEWRLTTTNRVCWEKGFPDSAATLSARRYSPTRRLAGTQRRRCGSG